MSAAVIIVAAGSGRRLGANVPKAFVELQGRSLLRWSVDQVVACPSVGHVIVVAPGPWLLTAREAAEESVAQAGRTAETSSLEAVAVDVVVGGAERRESVAAGLAALHTEDGIVLVHDAARSLAPPALFARVIDGIHAGHGAVIPGIEVVDTIKTVDAEGTVTGTLERSGLRAIQTPQGFVREVLVHAHSENLDVTVTDDAGLVELSGTPIHVVPGDPWAAKITTPDDLVAAERRLAGQEALQ